MGYYVNPPDQVKEEWLKEHGVFIAGSSMKNSTKEQKEKLWTILRAQKELPVILVNNGPWNAIPVCFSLKEMEVFTDKSDHRAILVFSVKEDLLPPVTPNFTLEHICE